MMKLVSCEKCGVVINTDNVYPTKEESEYYHEDPSFICPVCETKINYFTGES